MSIQAIVKDYIAAHPNEDIARLNYEQQTIWLKRRPESKETIWHRLLHYLTYIVPLPIIYPTVVTDGAQSLQDEALRLRIFAMRNIDVPAVLDVQPDYLVTSDVGGTMQKYLEELTTAEDKYRLLIKAMAALSQLHQAGLCHGRPFLRDMTYLNEQVFFIDLEEDPLKVMSLAEAQARDLWLFLNSVAKQCKNEPRLVHDLFECYLLDAHIETIAALKKMVLLIKPLRFFMEYSLLLAIKSRDLHCAVLVNKVLERYFKRANLITSTI